jgi:guanine deaminase
VAVSVGSDVGGGTSLSMQRTLADAYKLQAMAGQRLTAWKALHAATLGAAQALGLAHEIGSLNVGCVGDVCVWDKAVGPVALRRQEMAEMTNGCAVASNLHEQVFAWMTLSDERNLRATYVAGVAPSPKQGEGWDGG